MSIDGEILAWLRLAKGDTPGHEFHGNQYTGGEGSGTEKTSRRPSTNGIIDAVNQHEGATISMIGAKEPTSGFWVAKGWPNAAQVDIKDFEDRDKAAKAVSSFIKNNRDLLARPENYLGIFKDSSTGTVDFDVSEHMNDRETASSAGQARNQKSIWDISAGEPLDTGGSGVAKMVAVTKNDDKNDKQDNHLFIAHIPSNVAQMSDKDIDALSATIVSSVNGK